MACHSPYWDKPKGYLKEIPFNCGKCPACKSRRVQQWIFRIKQEFKVSTSAFFITLTYDTDHVPLSPNGFMTLGRVSQRKHDYGQTKYLDWQNFMRKLRKKQLVKIRYYACGEYGEQRKRPHWHAILFNVESSVHILDAWDQGKVDIDPDVNNRNIAYVASYVNKGGTVPAYANDDRLPEKSFMSKGLGAAYSDSSRIRQFHRANHIERTYVTDDIDGKKVPMPRYYRDRIFTESQLKDQRFYIANKLYEDELDDRLSFARRYRDNDNITLDDWELIRYERLLSAYNKFYKNQKQRDYD